MLSEIYISSQELEIYLFIYENYPCAPVIDPVPNSRDSLNKSSYTTVSHIYTSFVFPN